MAENFPNWIETINPQIQKYKELQDKKHIEYIKAYNNRNNNNNNKKPQQENLKTQFAKHYISGSLPGMIPLHAHLPGEHLANPEDIFGCCI